MGYRSQVGYVIHFKDPEDSTKVKDEYSKKLFYTFLTESKVNQKTMKAWDDEVKDGLYVKTVHAPSSWGAELYVDETNQLIRFEAHDVKWYDSYEDVDSHNAMIDLAEEYISGTTEGEDINIDKNGDYMSYTFVRIGEELDDVEHKSGGTQQTDSMLYPVSSIQWDI